MYICTLENGAKLDMEINVGVGRGYVSANMNKDEEQPLGYIPVDSIYTPVERASYFVEPARQVSNFKHIVLRLLNQILNSIDTSSLQAVV